MAKLINEDYDAAASGSYELQSVELVLPFADVIPTAGTDASISYHSGRVIIFIDNGDTISQKVKDA